MKGKFLEIRHVIGEPTWTGITDSMKSGPFVLVRLTLSALPYERQVMK